MSLLLLLQTIATAAAPALFPPTDLPFVSGEVLVYDARVRLIGRVGEATLRVGGLCRIDERDALALSFDITGGASFLRVQDETRSWIDPATLATIRYEKRESSPLGSHEESVTVSTGRREWEDAAGRAFETAGPLPIDELSLLYYVRTLPLRDGDTELEAEHFDVRRNPVRLRVLGRGTTVVPAGRFSVVEIELGVRDPRRYRGTGTIRIQLTDDAKRTPVRIRTSLPGSSTVTLELRAAAQASAPAACPGAFPDTQVVH